MTAAWKATFALVATVATTTARAQITVVVNGSNVQFKGQSPIMSGDRVLVPLRGVLEKMGATVVWDPQSQSVRAFRPKSEVRLRIGQNTATVNGKAVSLDVPATIVHGSTMVPLRFVGESLGEKVHWNEASQTVTISVESESKDSGEPNPPNPTPQPPRT